MISAVATRVFLHGDVKRPVEVILYCDSLGLGLQNRIGEVL
ncbi:hypothetical protein [Halomonas sp.]